MANMLGATGDCLPSLAPGIPQFPQVLVISPTRELATQIAVHARQLAIDTPISKGIKLAYGGASIDDQADKLDAGCHILIATIGRLLDFISRRIVDISRGSYNFLIVFNVKVILKIICVFKNLYTL